MSNKTAKIVGGVAIAAGVVGIGAALWYWLKKESGPEVFAVGNASGNAAFHQADAEKIAAQYGTLATMAQMTEAYKNGASWCAACWTMGDDGKMHVAMPINADIVAQCAGSQAGVNDSPLVPEQMDTYVEYVAVYGIKSDAEKIMDPAHGFIPWNSKRFSRWSS